MVHLTEILTHTHTQPFNGLWSETTQVGWYQKIMAIKQKL